LGCRAIGKNAVHEEINTLLKELSSHVERMKDNTTTKRMLKRQAIFPKKKWKT
jgi:hypothetical protein